MLTITETDFQRLVRFVKQNYGIDLSKKKQLILDDYQTRFYPWVFRRFRHMWII